MLVLLFGALWFILRDDLLYVLPCAILFLCFSVLLALRLPRLGKRELILVLFVCLIDLCLFGFVGFLFLLIWEGLRFVIVASSGLFSYLFFKPWVLVLVINLIFMFSLWCIDWVGSLYANRFFLCISVLWVISGPRVKFSSCKSALNPRWLILLTVLRRWSRCKSYFLLLCGLFYVAIRFYFCLVLLCSCVFLFFEHCDNLGWGR